MAREHKIAKRILDVVVKHAPKTESRSGRTRDGAEWIEWNALEFTFPSEEAGGIDWDYVEELVEESLLDYYQWGSGGISGRTPIIKIAKTLRERALAPRGTRIAILACSQGPCYTYYGVPIDVTLCPTECAVRRVAVV